MISSGKCFFSDASNHLNSLCPIPHEIKPFEIEYSEHTCEMPKLPAIISQSTAQKEEKEREEEVVME